MKDVHIVVIIIIIVAGFFILSGRPAPTEYTETRATETHSDIFFNYEIIRYPASVEITGLSEEVPTIGFNIDPDKLAFGMLLGEDGTSKRQINLTNRYDRPARVTIEVYGNIKPLLVFSKNHFILDEKTSLEVIADTTDQAPGNYSGEVDVIIQRSKYGLLNSLLGY